MLEWAGNYTDSIHACGLPLRGDRARSDQATTLRL